MSDGNYATDPLMEATTSEPQTARAIIDDILSYFREQGMGDDVDRLQTVLAQAVLPNDRFRFSIAAFDFIRREPDQSTVVVVCAEIKVEDDGTKTIIANPE